MRLISVRFWVRWLPILILLLAALLRFHAITAQSFWHDEGNTLRLVQRDIQPLIDAVKPDIHPPGYYVMLKGWTTFAGEHEFGLRSYSAFWGIIAVVFTYALGARLYARAAGILAAALVACNPFAIYYSQEARMYAQLAGLSVASLYLLARLVQTPTYSRRFLWIALGLAAVNTLGLYTQYTYPFTMIVQGIFFLWWWLKHRDRKALGVYVASNLIALLLYLPWLPTAYDQLTTWVTFDTGETFTEKLKTVLLYITFGNTVTKFEPGAFIMPGILFLSLVLPDWYRRPPSNRWRVLLPLTWLLIIVGALLFSGAYREANLKFLLPAQIALALLIGRGTYLLWDAGSGSAAVPMEVLPRIVAGLAYFVLSGNVIGGLDALYNDPQFQRDNYRGIADYLEQHATSDDAIILNAPNQYEVFTYYYDGNAELYPLPRGLGGDDTATFAETTQVIEQHPRIYVVFWGEGERDPNGIVKGTLDNNTYEIFSDRWYGNVRLAQYAVLEAPPETPAVAIDTAFGDHITLQGYAITGTPGAGHVLGVTLFWETDEPLTAAYKVSVQLLGPDGRLVSQHDSEPANNRIPTTTWQAGITVMDNHGLPIPAEAVPGEYQIIVSMYEKDLPENRLPVGEGNFLELERLSLE